MAFKTDRWTLANILPVAFVVWVICTIWLLYSWLHLHPLLQLGWAIGDRDENAYQRGLFQTIFSQTTTALLLICFARAIWTDPGSVPDSPDWNPEAKPPKLGFSSSESDRLVPSAPKLHEAKQSGARRFCKWCNNYKPDRCHHCRVCKSCILKMDHHCPWIANCVGFRNHKYFFLLVFYALVSCIFISYTMSESMYRSLEYQTTSVHRFLLVFGMTLSVIMGTLLVMFFGLHVWLMTNATTTIEFCEKRTRQNTMSVAPNFDHGLISNLRGVLGPVPLLWFLPVSPPEGTGLSFHIRKDKLPDAGNEEVSTKEPEKVSSTNYSKSSMNDTTYGTHDANDGIKTKQYDAQNADTTPPEVTGKGAATV